jgi:hypothetical protein
MRSSLLLVLAFICALIDHAQAANDHRIGCALSYGQDLPNCKGNGRTGVWGMQQVAQATSRTGGYDLYPGGGSPGGLAFQVIYTFQVRPRGDMRRLWVALIRVA